MITLEFLNNETKLKLKYILNNKIFIYFRICFIRNNVHEIFIFIVSNIKFTKCFKCDKLT